ncbi:Fe-S protein assembly co-chaperone HscB [Fimbriiglobus ruber]|uniref:Chaperone protein HscB n=1 Tax=Fimbriiglobus ruber TaxID=1908690 RepID=A0A225DG07_9BACT|nr:Fe-S protein assembly co-chaperone HscB [Fimbriiglobus ruber]OWK40501.1 Chaperone protein HscB [Fimbriiglobus ruber]
MDHFERLGLPRRFSVDLATVEREYLARSRHIHPDFHQLGSGAEQQASLELTAALNEAYTALRDPTRRAEYLVQLLGGPSSRDEKSLDQAFLMEMMDLRERMESARCENETAILETELTDREAVFLKQIADIFDRYEKLPEGDASKPALVTDVRRMLNALKTIRSLLRDFRDD